MGSFKLKRVYEPAGPDDGYRVLVDRLWPRGMTKAQTGAQWMKDVAPSRELCNWFAHDPAKFEDFGRQYREELAGESARPYVDELLSRVAESDVTLLYAAKDETHNQAVVLKQYLEGKRG